MTPAQLALKELIEAYNELRAKWLALFGNDAGFDAYFTTQVPGLN